MITNKEDDNEKRRWFSQDGCSISQRAIIIRERSI